MDKSALHLEHIARRLSPADRKAAGVQTASEAQAKAEACSERELQDAIAATLHRRGINYIRPRMDKRSQLAKGWSDFTVFLPGAKTVFLEVKFGTAQPEPDQTLFCQRVLAMGFEHYTVRSYDEAMRVLLL